MERKRYAFTYSVFLTPTIGMCSSRPETHEAGRDEAWEAGWNYPSKTSIAKYCESKGLQCEFVPFQVDFTIEERKDDLLRNWTIGDGDDRLVVNGLQLMFHFYLCKIYS